jgi:hypothetical protein
MINQDFTKGAKQFVVQEAFEKTVSFGSIESSLIPNTIVGTSLPLAGALMITRFAPSGRICAEAFARSVKEACTFQNCIYFKALPQVRRRFNS